MKSAFENALRRAFSTSAMLLVVCATSGCVCRAQYLWDGRTPDGVARPFYKVEKCLGQSPKVVCDSPTRLPNKGVCE